MKIFKIRNKVTGLYSTGGCSPRWTKKGKIWTTIGHLKSHIRQLVGRKWSLPLKDIANWELVELEVIEQENSVTPVQDMVNGFVAEQKAKEDKWELDRQRRNDLKQKALSKLTDAERRALNIS
jgi:hypothetical protein